MKVSFALFLLAATPVYSSFVGKKGGSKACKDLVVELDSSNCNDVIMQDAKLVDDMVCDCTRARERDATTSSYALQIAGVGVEVDLDGHTISCANTWPMLPPTDAVRSFLDFADDECTQNDRASYADVSACVLVTGASALIHGGKLEFCNVGIQTTGDFAEIYDMEIQKTFNDALVLSSNSNYVHENTVEDAGNCFNIDEITAFCDEPPTDAADLAWCLFYEDDDYPPPGDFTGDGIDVEAGFSGNRIEYNEVYRVADDGMDIDGSWNTIMGNTIEGVIYEDCLTSRGTGNVIMDNTIKDCGADGMDIKFDKFFPETVTSTSECTESADIGGCCHRIVGNEIETLRDGRGIKLEQNNNHVVDNSIRDPFDSCVRADDGEDGGNNNYISFNTCSGSLDARGFRSQGANNFLEFNTAKENKENGFEASGENNVFTCNNAFRNEENGFFVREDGNVFTANTANKNELSGFLVDEDVGNTEFVANRAFDNELYGFAEDSSVGSNVYTDNKAKDNEASNQIPFSIVF